MGQVGLDELLREVDGAASITSGTMHVKREARSDSGQSDGTDGSDGEGHRLVPASMHRKAGAATATPSNSHRCNPDKTAEERAWY